MVARSTTAPAAGELTAFLREQLPPYLLPAAFVPLDALPLSANGKLDRRALPAPERRSFEQAAGYAPPRDALEAGLAAIWAAVLGLERVGIYDDFFELGGHSLSAMEIIAQARDSLQLDVPLRSLFENPTVAELAHALGQAQPPAGEMEDEQVVTTPLGEASLEDLLAEIERLPDDAEAQSDEYVLQLLGNTEPPTEGTR